MEPKDNQENPFVTQIILISKKLTTITIKYITLAMKRFTLPPTNTI